MHFTGFLNQKISHFIQAYFESGFLGLATFFVIVFFPLIKALKCLKGSRLSEDRKYILIGALLGLVGLVLSALTAGFINSPVLSVLLAFFIATNSAIVYPVIDKTTEADN